MASNVAARAKQPDLGLQFLYLLILFIISALFVLFIDKEAHEEAQEEERKQRVLAFKQVRNGYRLIFTQKKYIYVNTFTIGSEYISYVPYAFIVFTVCTVYCNYTIGKPRYVSMCLILG